MTKLRNTYEGTLEQLKQDVADTKIPGDWEEMPNGYWRYRCVDGAVLNWWPWTDTISFQGPPRASAHFERQLLEVCRSKQVVDTDFYGDILLLMQCVNATAIPGAWQLKRKQLWRFRTSEGAILEWNESSKALTFKGPSLAAAALERRLFDVMSSLERRD